MSDLKTSILVNRQLPEFIRDEYPKFISFLEAYYEFLETKQIVNSVDTKSDLITKSKELRYITDVDASIDEFEQEFTNTFIPYLPKDTAINKDFIIKNILPLYLSKGSVKSYQLLFRLLFDAEVQVSYPRDNILRASDGRWVSENILRITTNVYSEYVSDGVQTLYYTPYTIGIENLNIFIDGVLITSGYSVRKEYNKIIFDTPVAENSIIKIQYLDLDPSIFVNRKITGVVSGTTALVERVGRRIISGSNYFELFVNNRTLSGDFFIGEKILTDIVNGVSIPISLQSYTSLESITVLNGGSSYNVGDPIIIRGASNKPAYAEVSSVARGFIDNILIEDGGVGFLNGTTVFAPLAGANSFNAFISSVDSTPENRLNALSYNTDTIDAYANVVLTDANFGFPTTTSNISSVIANTLTTTTISGLGSITAVEIDFSIVSALQETPLTINDIQLTPTQKMRDFGIIGLIDINSGGLNYQVGDQLIFTNPVGEYAGTGAAAIVSSVSIVGAITSVQITNGGLNYKLDSFPTITISSVSGAGANLTVNDLLGANSQILRTETSQYLPGEILQVKVLDAGEGYANTPILDLTSSGNKDATATAILGSSFETLPGRWTTNDSIISLEDIRLQGRDYYIDFSYVLKSTIEFDKYKTILKNLLHPSGLVNYATYETIDEIVIEGPLVQDKTTNLLLYSEEFDNAVWFKSGSSIAVDTVLSPNNTLTADKIIENTSSSRHGVYQSGLNFQVGDNTISFYAKPDGRSEIQFVAYGTGMTTQLPIINILYAEQLEDGWYRVKYTFNVDVVPTVGYIELWLVKDSNTDYLGDGTSGIYIWGAQLEVGNTATEYIPTTYEPESLYYEPYHVEDVLVTDNLVVGNLLDDARINVSAGSTTVVGTNINFIQFDSLEILKPGYYINVNSEIRIVSSIINSNTITVSEAFTYSSNLQSISVVNIAYNAITTQTYIELATQDGELIVT